MNQKIQVGDVLCRTEIYGYPKRLRNVCVLELHDTEDRQRALIYELDYKRNSRGPITKIVLVSSLENRFSFIRNDLELAQRIISSQLPHGS